MSESRLPLQPWQETILRLRQGQEAPEGYEIIRILGIYDEQIGTGTLFERVYVVACRREREALGA